VQRFFNHLRQLLLSYLPNCDARVFLFPGKWAATFSIWPIFLKLSQKHFKNTSVENSLTLSQYLVFNGHQLVLLLISIMLTLLVHIPISLLVVVIISLPLYKPFIVDNGSILIIRDLKISQEL
jgi:hypothetical protein